ncbi:MAG: hypothetical protein GEEBNDBF_02111 [bacterium]|nr:hypothetical protein [bacterium]
MTSHPTPERIAMYFDGIPLQAADHGLAAHLATCPECRQLADELQRLDSRLASPVPVLVPQDFTHRVMQQVAIETPMTSPWVLPTEVLSGVVMGAVGLAMLLAPQGTADPVLWGLSGAQWYALAAMTLLGIAPLWTSWRMLSGQADA